MTSANKELVRRFVEAINAQDWKGLERLVATNFRRHSHAAGEPAVKSRDDLIRFLKSEFMAFPDTKEELVDLIAEGDKVAARHRFTGTQLGPLGPYPPSGKVMIAHYLAIYEIREGVITQAWAEWDNASGLIQLGHI